MKLDYSLKTPQERIEYIQKTLDTIPAQEKTNQYLSYMSDYILFVADKDQTKKEHKKDHPIVTKNREVTVNKRQISFEEIISNLENGEDGLYSMITHDKNQIMDRKNNISTKDIEEVPQIKENLELIKILQEQFAKAQGAAKYSLKKQIIETWQQIYILRASYRGTPIKGKTSNQIKNMAHMRLDEDISLDENGFPQSNCLISLFNPAHVSFLLCYYSQLKEECGDDFNSDMYYLLLDLENLVDEALQDQPILYDLLIWKIDGKTNEEIQSLMNSHYGVQHNGQYFSTLWRKRIPKIIAEEAQKQWLIWYYTNEEYGQWKQCGKCGEVKLAHPLFFSRNSSKDHYYSICKECRRKK